jgi:hypothetical protein
MLVGADVPPRVGLFQTITTKAAGCTGGPIHIFGALTADTPWSPGCNTVYIIDGSVDFPAGVTLTVAPGAMVKAASGVPIENLASHASITVTNPDV